MKKMILLIITFFVLSISPSVLAGGYGMAECHIVIEQRPVSPGVLHVFVDKTCDHYPDIVMEYRAINGQWVYTGRWWWL